MSNVIRVVSKNQMEVAPASSPVNMYVLGLALVDSSTLVEIPSKFLQTDSATSGFVGVLPYGGVVFNSHDAGISDIVTITAHPLGVSGSGSDVSVNITLSDLVAKSVGSNLSSSSMGSISVSSSAGATSGKTALTISNYTKPADCSYVYKAASGTAPSMTFGSKPDSTWHAWDGTSELTITNNYKVRVVSVNGQHEAVASGTATVTAHA